MGRGFCIVIFMAMIVASMLHCSESQTTHVVGDALGWVIPPGGPIAYSTWAAMKTFSIGDTLVFNFTSGSHSVAEVKKAAFNSCDITNPISISTNGPTSISLNSAGEHYFICTLPSHCGAGQKLAINVSVTANSPSPQPAMVSPSVAPIPSSAVTPAPSPSGTTATPPSSMVVPPPSTAFGPTGTTVTNPSTPSPTSSPGNSAPTFKVAALPIAFFTIALTILY